MNIRYPLYEGVYRILTMQTKLIQQLHKYTIFYQTNFI